MTNRDVCREPNLYIESGEAVPEIFEFCETAKAHLAAAEEARIAIEKIREENEAQVEARAQAAAVPAAVPQTPPMQNASH